MIIGVVALMPDDWKTPVHVSRPGDTDEDGYPLPGVEFDTVPVLVGWRGTSDPVDRSEMTVDLAVLYADPEVVFTGADTITVPSGPWPHGKFEVDGGPMPWQMGSEVPLRRVGTGGA